MPRDFIAVDQSGLINHFAARSVNEVSALAHLTEEIRVQKSFRIRIHGHVDADNVGFAGHFRGRRFVFHAQRDRAFRSQAATPGNYRHAKSSSARNHFLPNLSHAYKPERPAKKSTRF